MTRSRLGDQISAHISKSARMGDMRHLLQIVYEVDDTDRQASLEAYIKRTYSQQGCGYWKASRNMFFVKVPVQVEPNTAFGVHFHLMPLLDKAQDQLVVMGPLWEVDTEDWGLEVDDAVDFGRALV